MSQPRLMKPIKKKREKSYRSPLKNSYLQCLA